MSEELIKFEFKEEPKNISYTDGEPLNLTDQFSFYHNKSRFRKELTRLQTLFKLKINAPILASGIRDSYLKEEYTENNLIIIFTTSDKIRDTNEILKSRLDKQHEKGCVLIESTKDYMLLLSKEMNELTLGIDYIEEILNQVIDEYIERKNFDEHIKIRPFKLIACAK